MKDRILNISIIVLVIACLFLGGRLLYKNYMDECEAYNNNIVNFAVEMIKGNKSLEDIDSLDANDSVKEGLRTYYNDNFYADDDLILIYEDVAYFRQHKDGLKEMQLSYGDAIYDGESEYFYQFVNEGDDVSEEERKYNHLASTYLYYNEGENTNGIVEKDNNLYIDPNVLDFSELDGYDVYYDGLKIYINKYNFDKSIRSVRAEDEFFKTLSVVNVLEEDNRVYVLKNSSKGYIIKGEIYCNLALWKIDNLRIQLQ